MSEGGQRGCLAIHWVKNNWFFRGILCSLAAIIVAAIARALIGGITFKMIYEALINLDIFYVLEGIFVILLVVFSVLFVRQQWKNSIDKKEEEKNNLESKFKEEKKHLESKLEDMTTKYNKLFEKTKPPHSNIDSLIKAEEKCNFGAVRVLPDDLSFNIRVINRTNYLFTCKKAFIACYHDSDCLCKEKWEEGEKPQHIFPSSLEVLEDGNIEFSVPIQKLGDVIDSNNRELMLDLVYAEYSTEEVIIHDTQRKSVKVECRNLKYRLDEEAIQKLKGKVEKS